MKNNIESNKGITLVSLVVTVIVLIILAGISINMTLGENGILTMAKRAKENIERTQLEEQTKLNELYMQIEKEEGETGGEISYDAIAKLNDFKKKIADYIEEAGGIKPEYTASTETFGQRIKEIVANVTKDATAIAEDIALGKTAWVNGEKITGTMDKNKATVYYLGTGTSFNLSSFEGYQNFTNDNFIVGVSSAPDTKMSYYTTGSGSVEDRAAARGFSISKSYNSSTGILTLSGASQIIQIHKNTQGYMNWGATNQNMNTFAYLILGNIETIQ